MADEEKKQQSETTEPTSTTEELLAQLEKMKKETVPLDKYTKALEDNKVLINQVLNGGTGGDEQEQEVIYSDEELNKLREELFDTEKHDLTNLEYVTKAVQLRDAILQKSGGKTDIFVGTYNSFEPSQEDYYRAENTAEVFKECIEYAKGDSQLFTQELQRRMKGR